MASRWSTPWTGVVQITAEFFGAKYQDLYDLWKAAGSQAVTQALAPKAQLPVPLDAGFSTYFLSHSYSFLGKTEQTDFAVR